MLLLALGLRLGWGLSRPSAIDERLPDQREYLQLAENLLRHGQLVMDHDRFGPVRAYRMPGYPLFLALCGASATAARMAQAVIDASVVLAVYLVARRWLSAPTALLASLATALNPFQIYFAALILSETLFTAMLAWGTALLAWRPGFLWGGIVLALAVHVRPSAVFLPLAMGYCAVFATHSAEMRRRRGWLRLPVGAGMLLLTAAALTPWWLRNLNVLESWVWLTTNGGITRYDGFNPDATGASDQSFLDTAVAAPAYSLNELARDRYFADLASSYIRETWQDDPARLLKLTLAKLARTWSPMPLSAEFGGRALYRWIALSWCVPLFALALVGLCRRELPRPARALLVAPALYFTVIHAMSVGSLRYRVPAEPLLSVLAAAGATAILPAIAEGLRRVAGRRVSVKASGNDQSPQRPADAGNGGEQGEAQRNAAGERP